MFLRQSTSQVIRFGPFLDSTDGVTAETALTIAQADMQLSLDGGAFAQKNAAGNATHDTDGWYSTTLNATDTATIGELVMQVNVTGALPVWKTYYVVEESIYDGLFASGSAYVAQTGDSFARIGANGSGLTTLATQASVNTVDTNVDAILVDTAEIGAAGAGLTAIPRVPANVDQVDGVALGTHQAGHLPVDVRYWIGVIISTALQSAADIRSEMDSNSTQLAAIVGDTNELQTDWANGGRLDLLIDQIITDIAALNNISAADVNAQVLDVLNTDTFAEPTGAPAATATLSTKLGYLYMALRNRVDVTASTKTFYDDGGTAEWSKSLSDDGTTYTEAEGA